MESKQVSTPPKNMKQDSTIILFYMWLRIFEIKSLKDFFKWPKPNPKRLRIWNILFAEQFHRQGNLPTSFGQFIEFNEDLLLIVVQVYLIFHCKCTSCLYFQAPSQNHNLSQDSNVC